MTRKMKSNRRRRVVLGKRWRIRQRLRGDQSPTNASTPHDAEAFPLSGAAIVEWEIPSDEAFYQVSTAPDMPYTELYPIHGSTILHDTIFPLAWVSDGEER